MHTRTAHCPSCSRSVEVMLTGLSELGEWEEQVHQAEPVCLDFGARCHGPSCPVFGLPRIVLGVRIPASDAGAGFPTHTARCDCCGAVVDMIAANATHGVCPECEALNRVVVLRVEDGSLVAVAHTDFRNSRALMPVHRGIPAAPSA